MTKDTITLGQWLDLYGADEREALRPSRSARRSPSPTPSPRARWRSRRSKPRAEEAQSGKSLGPWAAGAGRRLLSMSSLVVGGSPSSSSSSGVAPDLLEIGSRLQRILVLGQRGVVARQRHAEAGRQACPRTVRRPSIRRDPAGRRSRRGRNGSRNSWRGAIGDRAGPARGGARACAPSPPPSARRARLSTRRRRGFPRCRRGSPAGDRR